MTTSSEREKDERNDATANSRPPDPFVPLQPDAALAQIVGTSPLPRAEVTNKVWDYIQKNKR